MSEDNGHMTKRCRVCQQEQSLAEFHRKKDSADGYATWCRTCARNYYCRPESRERDRQRRRNYYRQNREELLEKERWRHLRKKYGLSQERFLEILDAQCGGCAICAKPLVWRDPSADQMSRAHVDHDHATGAVRGILCGKCNFLIGLAKDRETVLQAALEYLRDYR